MNSKRSGITEVGIVIENEEWVETSSLKSDGKNPNVMSQNRFDALKASLKKYGWLAPIITNEDLLIADGEHRWKAAQELGMEKVKIIRLPVKDVDRRLLRQVLNKVRGEHDSLLDREEFRIIFGEQREDDLRELLGLSNREYGSILDLIRPEEEKNADEMPTESVDSVKTFIRPGEVYALGQHRIMCGDSTDKESVSLLMGGAKASMIFTDPPYGVQYVGKTKEALTIENDSLGEEGTARLWKEAYENAREVLVDGASIYATVPAGPLHLLFAKVMKDHDDLRQILVWAKDSFVLGRSDYHYRHEPILYGWKSPGKHEFLGGRDKDSVWEFKRPTVSKEHPTMKPVALMEFAIKNSTSPNEIVLDVFLGSGSTLMACETTERRCYGLEIDPRYCQVIINRWEKFTGKKAEKVSS